MLLRNLTMTALAAAALVALPASAEAQDTGLNRALVASAASHDAPGYSKNQATKRAKKMPPGMDRAHADGALPPGISRTRPPAPAPAPQPEPEPEPEPDNTGDGGGDTGGSQCIGGLLFVGGVPVGPC